MEVLGFIGLLALMGGAFYLLTYNPWAQKAWERLPTEAEYRARTGQTGALHCGHCCCGETLDVGLLRVTDYRRQHLCTKCKNTLWRSQL
ncbi:hypothetical protein [Jeongeupia sp. USM3]|uniref:hypothetical protein n=1 Tax=Jeongeupia sp. USM3 TaxID=1906741 RepID=UPI00089E060A|nr:hypothetical protein [Jeongeupia sp. USM3]AOX99759.1 hypothetical protein BJP62_04375 [Jeongeupia sp. USM3]